MVLIFAALLLASGCLPHRPAPAGPDLVITQSWACPLPAHRGLIRLSSDGRAAMSILEGLDGPSAGRTERQKKSLPPEDMAELAAMLSKSGYREIPDRAESFPPRHEQTDPCSRSLEITERGETKRISFRDGDIPDALQRLLSAIDAVLERTPWQPDVYPWEGR